MKLGIMCVNLKDQICEWLQWNLRNENVKNEAKLTNKAGVLHDRLERTVSLYTSRSVIDLVGETGDLK